MAYVYVMHPDNRIRELRKRAGLSQKELGQCIGMHQAHFSHLENGQRPLTLDWARRIARELNVSVADLLTDADHPLRLEDDERTLVERYRAADAQQRLNMLRVTEALSSTNVRQDRAA